MNEDTIREILESSKDEIQRLMIEKTKEEIVRSYHWKISELVGSAVSDFFEKEMGDEIAKTLSEQRDIILEQVKTAIVDVSGVLAGKMLKKATENLTMSYKSDKIIKDIFD